MTEIERNIRIHFESWLKKDVSVLLTVFEEDALYVESYGPAYRGITEIG